MEKEPKEINENKSFTSLRPDGVTVITDRVPAHFDLSRFEAEDGLVYFYTSSELKALGDGDEDLGYEKVRDFIVNDDRSVLQMSLDPKKPLEDELEGVDPDTKRSEKVIITLNNVREIYIPRAIPWEFEIEGNSFINN